MKLCSFEFAVDNGMLTIGAAEAADGEQPTLEDLPAVAATQLFMRCRQQIAPVRVGFWRGEAPPSSYEILSVKITLPHGLLTVGETFLRPYLSWPVCAAGQSVDVRIGVDDEDDAASVTVLIYAVGARLPSSRDRAHLVRALAEYDQLEKLDVVTAEHSFPLERFSSAFHIIRHGVASGAAGGRVRYGVQTIVEWMRWLKADISRENLEGVDGLIMSRVGLNVSPDQAAREILAEFAGRLGVSLEELLFARR
ncbi:hypothetical protein [Actinoplanes palleronii]|uniref:Uncharacterized protein n=1 Tax=Actinoplanes palleronii TaxID=113570 RepID=A0ABQ4BN88_9ACTN|nr:hypothetical protein [Actinoplanes palleronii]GIE71756.1 hypothetical protein Apa02nite_078640 [Actinoplanes palleronii]